MLVRQLYHSCSFAFIFEYDFVSLAFADFDEAHVDEGFEQELALHFIDPDGEVSNEAILSDDGDLLVFILDLLGLVLDLGEHGQSGSDFLL